MAAFIDPADLPFDPSIPVRSSPSSSSSPSPPVGIRRRAQKSEDIEDIMARREAKLVAAEEEDKEIPLEEYPCQADFPDWLNGETTVEDGEIVSLLKCSLQKRIRGYDAYILPPGAAVFHGSTKLTESLVEFPVGRGFYDEKQRGFSKSSLSVVADSYKGIEENLAILNHEYIAPSWYSDPKVAQIYTGSPQCKGDCVFMYRTNKQVRLLQLDSHRNVYRLLTHSKMTPQVGRELEYMMGVKLSQYNEQTQSFSSGFARVSRTLRDTVFARWFCDNFSAKFDGYAADAIQSGYDEEELALGKKQPTHFYSATYESKPEFKFHPEIVFCNAFNVLERRYEGYDWQSVEFGDFPPYVVKFVEQLFLYKTINTGFHSGNLLQHSVWSLLWSEAVMKLIRVNAFSAEVRAILEDVEIQKLATFGAFIHDIGKMKPFNVNNGEIEVYKLAYHSGYVYYDVVDHPLYGFQFVLMDEGPDEFDPDNSEDQIGILNMEKLASDMGVSYTENNKLIIAASIYHHRDLGLKLLKPLNEDPSFPNLEGEMQSYLTALYRTFAYIRGNVNNDVERIKLVYVSSVIAGADILATQPPKVPETGMNIRSRLFPYMSNFSKNYPGITIETKVLIPLIETLIKMSIRYTPF